MNIAFTTSGIVSSLDGGLAAALGLPAGAVLQTHCDHEDLVHTLSNLVSGIDQFKQPTNCGYTKAC